MVILGPIVVILIIVVAPITPNKIKSEDAKTEEHSTDRRRSL